MKPLRPILAALLLVAWLFAGAHMAQEHGGDSAGNCVTCEHCHDEAPAPAGEHHHHDFGAVPLGKVVGVHKAALTATLWTPLAEHLLAQFAALQRRAETAPVLATFGNSPPDERASGWLLVSHTALPVRGPSLA